MATNKDKKALSSKEDKRHKKAEEAHVIANSKQPDAERDPLAVALEVKAPTPAPPSSQPPSEPTAVEPEATYEEPKLTDIIVKEFKGQLKKGDYDGFGEAIFTGGHAYVGEFSAGFMHGRGKYTWQDGVSYEGDFYQNQIIGTGTYKWPDGSQYDGEVMNGLRHGQGTYTVKDGVMSYTGEWQYGKRQGKGRMNFDREKHSFYDGDWVDGIKQGYGTRQYPSGNLYQGMWYNNLRHGEGTMKWIDRNQMYMGQWEDGVQHGRGQLVWFLKRVPGSQYPLRNMYDGQFVRGIRDGYGAFYYADGARYEGYWMNNMKHGRGKFTFKNGRIYEGIFEKDHIKEYPSLHIDGNTSPEPGLVRTRTPLPMENMSVHSNKSTNTIGPSFRIEIGGVLEAMPDCDPEAESRAVTCIVLRHMSALKKIYDFYSALGMDDSPDNTYNLNRLQFWRLMKDCQFHHMKMSLIDLDSVIGALDHRVGDNPYDQGILFREFLNHLITLAYYIYGDTVEGKTDILAECFQRLVTENLLKHGCKVKGYFYYEARRAINALVHVDQSFQIYCALCKARKCKPTESSLKMREFLHLLQDVRLINADLTAKAVIEILASDDPNVADEQDGYNLELEMTFLEFFEALVGCAERFVTEAVVKDPTTPNPTADSPVTAGRDAAVSAARSKTSEEKSVKDESNDEEGEDGEDAVSHVTHASQRTASVKAAGGTLPSRSRPPSSEAGGTTTAAMAAEREKSGHESKREPSNCQSTTVKEKDNASNRDAQSAVSGAADGRSGVSGMGSDAARQPDQTMTSPEMPEAEGTLYSEENAPLTSCPTSVATKVRFHLPRATWSLSSSVPLRLPRSPSQASGLWPRCCRSNVRGDRATEDDLDPETRKFNFWTHQVHIFFVRKFFPAFEKYEALRKLVAEKYGHAQSAHNPNCICGRG